jgi:hypothetical protein
MLINFFTQKSNHFFRMMVDHSKWFISANKKSDNFEESKDEIGNYVRKMTLISKYLKKFNLFHLTNSE